MSCTLVLHRVSKIQAIHCKSSGRAPDDNKPFTPLFEMPDDNGPFWHLVQDWMLGLSVEKGSVAFCFSLLWNIYWIEALENTATNWYNYSQLLLDVFTCLQFVFVFCLKSLSTLLWCRFSSQSLLKCHHLKIAHYLYLIILGVSAIWRKIAFTLGSENYKSTIQLYYESQQVGWRYIFGHPCFRIKSLVRAAGRSSLCVRFGSLWL